MKKTFQCVKKNICLFLCSFICPLGIANSSEPVNRVLTAKGDVIGRGQSVLLILRVKGNSKRSPYDWNFRIIDSEKYILYSYYDKGGPAEDSIFKTATTSHAVSNCASYDSCKEKYYFRDLPKELFSILNPSIKSWGKDNDKIANLRFTASNYLKKNQISENRINKALVEMITSLEKPGYRALVVPESPLVEHPPMIWVHSVHMFVPFYQQ